jgi:acyl-CoA thioesterase FadM
VTSGARAASPEAQSDIASSDTASPDVASPDIASVAASPDPRADADRSVAEVVVPYRVRFDECGPDGLVRTSALLRYAQDAAWIHSERLGFGRDWYAERGLAWVVRAAEIVVLDAVPLGATLDVTTRVTGFRRVWARRRTEARLADGTLAMWGHTDWVMTDDRGMPARVPSDFPSRFAVPPGAFEPGRVRLPPTPPEATVTVSAVRPQDLDPMGRVNNATYLDYLEEAVIGTGRPGEAAIGALPRCVRLEYLMPAAPGARLQGAAWPGSDAGGGAAWSWRLTDAAGEEIARGSLAYGDGEPG